MSPAKTAEPIEMSFGFWVRMDTKNRVRWGFTFPHGKGQFFGGNGRPS